MTERLITALNDVCTYLAEGEAWHMRVANQCRKLHIRGLGRWHEAEACGDFKHRECLEKLLMDNCKIETDIEPARIVDSMTTKFNGMSDFKQHFFTWAEREELLISALSTAIDESRLENIELYHKLCCIQKEVQNERMRAEWAYHRLDLAGWNGHDIGVVSMIIHSYFEKEYDGGLIDFNIG